MTRFDSDPGVRIPYRLHRPSVRTVTVWCACPRILGIGAGSNYVCPLSLSNIPHILDSLFDNRAVLNRILLCLFRMTTQRTRHPIRQLNKNVVSNPRYAHPQEWALLLDSLAVVCADMPGVLVESPCLRAASIFKRACSMVPQLCCHTRRITYR